MIAWIAHKVAAQNRWYDSLGDSHRGLRFLLFLTPQLIGFTVDLYWVILFAGMPMFTYLAWLLMAVWRIPYVISRQPRR